ncbi:MAG: metallophosphoesterase [Deltaproteobacteria bacterium]|nr:metallophosphoesterase [Deltaproteobacteria bacterium]
MPKIELNRQESELLAEAIASYRQFVSGHEGYDSLFPHISNLTVSPETISEARDLVGTFLPFDHFVDNPAALEFMARLNRSVADDMAPFIMAPRELWRVRDLLASEERSRLRKAAEEGAPLPAAVRLRLQTERVLQERARAGQKEFKLVVLGDIHGKWTKVQEILDLEFPDGNGIALSVGDLENYPLLSGGHRIYFISGNHENFSQVARMRWAALSPFDENYSPIFAGDLLRLGGLTVAGIPGVYSPWFFDHPRYSPMKYFTPDDFRALEALRTPVDILLLHEAPHGVGFEKEGEDLGKPLLTGLVEFLKPRLVFFGHHHVGFRGSHGDTMIVGLEKAIQSYVVIKYDSERGGLFLQRPSVDVSRGTAIFGPAIPLNRKERFAALLENRHRENVRATLKAKFLEELLPKIEEREFKARIRAAAAINEAIPYVASYLAALEASPYLSVEEKKDVLTQIFQEMRQPGGVPAYAMNDVNRAFEMFLREWGLVDVENLFIREVKGSGQVAQVVSHRLADDKSKDLTPDPPDPDSITDTGPKKILPFKGTRVPVLLLGAGLAAGALNHAELQARAVEPFMDSAPTTEVLQDEATMSAETETCWVDGEKVDAEEGDDPLSLTHPSGLSRWAFASRAPSLSVARSAILFRA